MKHATIEVAYRSSLGALETCGAILFGQWNLLYASEVTSLTFPDLNNKALDGARIVALVVGGHDPKFIVMVVHLSGAEVAETLIGVTFSAGVLSISEI